MKRYVAKQIKAEFDKEPNKYGRRVHQYHMMSSKNRASFVRKAMRVWRARLIAVGDIREAQQRQQMFDSSANPHSLPQDVSFSTLK